MFVNNMFMFSGIVLITMHHLAGYQWNIIVHCYCVGVMTLWGLILMMFARLGYVFFSTNNMSYVNLNMHYVQLEVGWMMITAMHWYYHVINPDVAPPHMDREYVWKHVTKRMSPGRPRHPTLAGSRSQQSIVRECCPLTQLAEGPGCIPSLTPACDRHRRPRRR